MKIFYIIWFIFITLLISCTMSNQEIIDEVAFCHGKDMDARYVFGSRTGPNEGEVTSIICVPPEKEKECKCDCKNDPKRLEKEIDKNIDYEE